MTDELPPEPRMLPLRVRVSPQSDDTMVLRPGDPGYLSEYRMAAYDFRRFGRPMPYADEEGEVSMSEPPRRPLRVPRADRMVGGPHPDANGGMWQILRPGDPDYERAYQIAVAALRAYDSPMPYADMQDAGTMGDNKGRE